MDRRHFIKLGGAVASLAFVPYAVQAGEMEYTPGLARKELAAGKTVFLDFSATWCTTCQAQARVIDQLQAENPAYGKNISFIRVDWDQYGNGDLARALKIPRRSTLVVLQGDKELGRVVAGTSKKVIKGLMDTALAAASS